MCPLIHVDLLSMYTYGQKVKLQVEDLSTCNPYNKQRNIRCTVQMNAKNAIFHPYQYNVLYYIKCTRKSNIVIEVLWH